MTTSTKTRPAPAPAAPAAQPIIFLNLEVLLDVGRVVRASAESSNQVGRIEANPPTVEGISVLRELRDAIGAQIVITDRSHSRNPADTLLDGGMVPGFHPAPMSPSSSADRAAAIATWLRQNGPAQAIVIDRPGVDVGDIRVSVAPFSALSHSVVRRVVAMVSERQGG